MYEIEFTPEATEDLKTLRKFEQKKILDEIESQLRHTPTAETRNRKKLRPNAVADWEIRIGRFRAFYNVYKGAQTVSVEAIGYKVGNLLFIHGRETKL